MPRLWGETSRLGLVVAIGGFLADQASKSWLLHGLDLARTGPIALAPFAEFRLVWNYGISYGLLRQEGDLGRWLLVAVSVAASIFLWLWLARNTSRHVALSLGLVLGGALGNALDRAVYGAVVDFVHLFIPDGSFSWYVFNLADAWIVAGVIGLLYDMLRSGPNGATKSGST